MQDDASLLPLVGQELAETVPPGTPLEAYLQWACRQHSVPPLYHIASALAVAVHELARHGFAMQTGVPMSMWFALIGESASGKSGAVDMIDDFIHEVWTLGNCTPVNDPWVEANGSVAGLLTAINEHFDPTRKTTVCVLYAHELSSLFNTRESIAEFMCNLADGRTIQRNLRELQGRGPGGRAPVGQRLDRIYLPTTSGLFATTEPTLSAVFTEAMRHGGLFSRLWWIRPKWNPSELKMRELDYIAERERALTAWVGWIAGMGLHESRVITWAPEAWTRLKDEFFTPNTQACSEGDDFNAVRIRSVEKVQVLSGVFATMNGRTQVTAADVGYAIAFGQVLLKQAALMQNLGSSELMRLVARSQAYIRFAGNEGLTRRDLYRKLRRDKRTIELVLETLLDSGEVTEDRASVHTRYLAAETARAQEIKATRDRRIQEVGEGIAAGNVVDLTKRRG